MLGTTTNGLEGKRSYWSTVRIVFT